MNRKLWLAVGVTAMVAVLLAGCVRASAMPPAEGGAGYSDVSSLIPALQAADAPVELAGTVSQAFFEPEGQIVQIFGQDVQVFDFDSGDKAGAAAAQVSPDGSSIGTTMVTWVATPHFYWSGELIVLYVGDNAQVLELLTQVLGPQFAGR